MQVVPESIGGGAHMQSEESLLPDGDPTEASSSSGQRKRQKQQARQLQACSKCRERKVKCDKTLPCSACCARGQPKECVFSHADGADHAPIAQSHELRRLRIENQKLRELLQDRSRNGAGSEDDLPSSSRTPASLLVAGRKLGIDEPSDTIYFGTPGFMSVASELLNAASTSSTQNLLHPATPHDFFAQDPDRIYPFPTFWTSATWIQGLCNALQPWQETAQILSPARMNDEPSTYLAPAIPVCAADLETFMADFETNATTHPDVLGLIFITLASEMKRQEVKHSAGGRVELPASNSVAVSKRNMFVAAAMQALRASAFMSSPSLTVIQATLLLAGYVLNDARALDSWTLMGSVIRVSQAAGLHRNPQLLNPTPSSREGDLRKTLWWKMLYFDQQLSVAMGRPLGISSIGDCPLPEPSTSDSTMVRLTGCIEQFIVLCRQIMGAAPMLSHRTVHFAEKLETLLDTIPDGAQFRRSWLLDHSSIPEPQVALSSAYLHLEVHSTLLILFQQRTGQTPTQTYGPSGQLPEQLANRADYSGDDHYHKSQALIVASGLQVLDAFEYMDAAHPSQLDWMSKQRAFTAAAAILPLAAADSSDRVNIAMQTTLRILQRHAIVLGDPFCTTASKSLIERLNPSASSGYGGSHETSRNSQVQWSSGPRNISAVHRESPFTYGTSGPHPRLDAEQQYSQGEAALDRSDLNLNTRRATFAGPEMPASTSGMHGHSAHLSGSDHAYQPQAHSAPPRTTMPPPHASAPLGGPTSSHPMYRPPHAPADMPIYDPNERQTQHHAMQQQAANNADQHAYMPYAQAHYGIRTSQEAAEHDSVPLQESSYLQR